jgi:hypothetical protein
MSRIFTFGCSFTEYIWPTWADIILKDNKGYNFGKTGAGYDQIMYSILEADRQYTFTHEDKIIIMFTTPIRWDLIKGSKTSWICSGQITNSNYSQYLDELYSVDGLIFKSIYNIVLIDSYLKQKHLNYYFGSINNLFQDVGNYFENLELEPETYELIDHVRSNIKFNMTSFHDYLYPNSKEWVKTKVWEEYVDYHPTITEQYEWVKNILLKKIDIDVKTTNEDVSKIQEMVDGMKSTSEMYKLEETFPSFYEHRRTDRYVYFENAKPRNKKLI